MSEKLEEVTERAKSILAPLLDELASLKCNSVIEELVATTSIHFIQLEGRVKSAIQTAKNVEAARVHMRASYAMRKGETVEDISLYWNYMDYCSKRGLLCSGVDAFYEFLRSEKPGRPSGRTSFGRVVMVEARRSERRIR